MAWLKRYAERLRLDSEPNAVRQRRMNAVNPLFVPRNYLAQLAIDQAEAGDYSMLHEWMEVLRRPYDEQPGKERFAAKRPEWGAASRRLFDALMQFVNALRVLLAVTAPLTLAAELFGEAPPQRLEDASPMDNMIAEIQQDAQRTSAYTGIERIDDAVIVAVRGAPRQQFVPERNRSLAYANHPLPIGHGQTISQPFIVALMTQLLDLEPHHRVLEIGAGSGYQAAVLARLAAEVYSIEIVPELAAAASKRLARLGYDNVQVSAGDGWRGWPEQAPFDRVIVTAVASRFRQR